MDGAWSIEGFAKDGVLRVSGDPDTFFGRDGMFILWSLWAVSEFGICVEPEAESAMKRRLCMLDNVPADKLREALEHILCGKFVCRALLKFPDVIFYILPELRPMLNCDQQNPHHLYDVWKHSVIAVGQTPPSPVLRLAMLLHDCGKPICKTVDANGVGHFYRHPEASFEIAKKIVSRLGYPSEDSETILQLIKQHDVPFGNNEKQIRRKLGKLGEKRFRELLQIKKGDAVGQGVHRERIKGLCEIERLLNSVLSAEAGSVSLAINGYDLKALGLSGHSVGAMLSKLLKAVSDDNISNDKDALLAFARKCMEGRHDK